MKAPSTSLNGLVRKSWDAAGGEFAIQLDGNWSEKQFLEGTNSLVSVQESYAVFNAQLSYGTERWNVAGWVKNLGDEDYLFYNLDLGLAGFIEQVFAPPRQYGLTVQMNW